MEIKTTLEPGMAPPKVPAAIRAENVTLADAVQREEDGKEKQQKKNQQQKKQENEQEQRNQTAASGHHLDVVV